MKRAPGRAIYTGMLNPRGGYESGVTALRIREDLYRIYTGSAAIRRDMGWLYRHLDGERVEIRDVTENFATFGLMGPDAARIASEVGAGSLNDLSYFRHGESEIAGAHLHAVRLSYVGEAGWEFTCKASNAERIYDALHATGARLAGLYAQTAMRVEKGYRAMGHELNSDVTPLEAGLEFAVAWNSNFIGREALLHRRDEGIKSRIVTILLDDNQAVPLGNEPVYRDTQIIGKTTSAAFGYRIGRPVALAEVDSTIEEGAAVEVDITRQMWMGRVILHPAYDPTSARIRKAKGT